MRTTIALLIVLVSSPCLAQKWIDDKGRVHYGDPPAGVNVREVPMTGGTTSSVGSQQPNAGSARAERQFQERAGNRARREESARQQQETNRRLSEAASQARQKQQEEFQRRQAQEAARNRRQEQDRCRALNRC